MSIVIVQLFRVNIKRTQTDRQGETFECSSLLGKLYFWSSKRWLYRYQLLSGCCITGC